MGPEGTGALGKEKTKRGRNKRINTRWSDRKREKKRQRVMIHVHVTFVFSRFGILAHKYVNNLQVYVKMLSMMQSTCIKS